jgi:hypothetical protein
MIFFPLLALFGVFACTFRSLGLGLVAAIGVGYFNGVIRANYLSVHTTFMFDFGLLGLYLGFFVGRPGYSARIWNSALGQWTLALIAWPALLVVIPVNDYLVQLVALRATIWFLPVVLIASRFRIEDLTTVARGLAILNLMALIGGIYVYQNGLESLYPNNAITQILYASKDVAEAEHYRIPSTFLSAHAYGGTMLFSLPFLLDRLFGRGAKPFERGLMAVGVVAAVGGILMCAARQPVVTFVAASLVLWAVTRFNPTIGAVALALTSLTLLYASSNVRLQRIMTLEDTELVSDRISTSMNASLIDLMADYPAGAGMGSSVGTSIPYFLADKAPEAIGLENEYSRILIDQGLIGLALWFGFIIWLLHRPPPLRLAAPGGLGIMIMFALVLTNWSTAFIGAGTLSSVPCSVILLMQMGILIRWRTPSNGTNG